MVREVQKYKIVKIMKTLLTRTNQSGRVVKMINKLHSRENLYLFQLKELLIVLIRALALMAKNFHHQVKKK
jgi:hypothetical protein